LAKLKVTKTHDKTYTCKGRKIIIDKWWKLEPNTLLLMWKKKKKQTYNVIFVWDKRPNFTLNPSLNLTLNLLYFILTLNNLTIVNFKITMKDHIHGLAAKLCSNNEQDINTLDIL